MKVSELLAKDMEIAGLRLNNHILAANQEIVKLTAARDALVAQAQQEAGVPASYTRFDTESREFSDPNEPKPLSAAKSRQVKRAEARKAKDV